MQHSSPKCDGFALVFHFGGGVSSPRSFILTSVNSLLARVATVTLTRPFSRSTGARAEHSWSVRIWPETKRKFASPIVGAAFPLRVWSRNHLPASCSGWEAPAGRDGRLPSPVSPSCRCLTLTGAERSAEGLCCSCLTQLVSQKLVDWLASLPSGFLHQCD